MGEFYVAHGDSAAGTIKDTRPDREADRGGLADSARPAASCIAARYGAVTPEDGARASRSRPIGRQFALVETIGVEGRTHCGGRMAQSSSMELHRVHWPAFECECEVRPLEDM